MESNEKIKKNNEKQYKTMRSIIIKRQAMESNKKIMKSKKKQWETLKK